MRRIFLLFMCVLLTGGVALAEAPSWVGVAVTDEPAGGVRVSRVEESSPAALAGVEAGDLIQEFNGIEVLSVRQFTRIVGETPVGRTVSVTLLRGSDRRTVDLTTGARPGFRDLAQRFPEAYDELSELTARARRAMPDFRIAMAMSRLGMRVEGMTPELREFFGVDREAGVLVSSVEVESPAGTAGVRVGDVVVELDGRAVDSPMDFYHAARGGGDPLTLGIVRDGSEMEVTLDPEPSND